MHPRHSGITYWHPFSETEQVPLRKAGAKSTMTHLAGLGSCPLEARFPEHRVTSLILNDNKLYRLLNHMKISPKTAKSTSSSEK